MGVKDLYNKLLNKPEEVTWIDFFTDFYKRHSKQEMNLVLSAGKSYALKSKTQLLDIWQKPWLFYKVLKYGLCICGIIYVVLYMLIEYTGSISIPAINLFVIIVFPLLPPIVIMIFFWELNIPRNISLLELLGVFLAGGFLSLVAAAFMLKDVPVREVAYAPFVEEPAKLIISVVFLALLSKKPKFKIWGLTGLVIGAAVGAGFGGFESVQYGIKGVNGEFYVGLLRLIDKGDLIFLFQNQLARGVWAVAGHTLFCAPYTAAVALHTENGKITEKSFLNKDFGVTYGTSFICHFIWNSISITPGFIIITIVLWMNSLTIVKKSFIQVLKVDEYSGGGHYFLQGIAGPFAGRKVTLGKTVLIGRSSQCNICLPESTQGVSGTHCRIVSEKDQLFIIDVGSTYGTYVNGIKVQPKVYQKLKSGDRIILGSTEAAFMVCRK